MKLFSTYIKEMKIAARGFYFYVEIIFAVILLVILLVAVKEESVSKEAEYLYNDIPSKITTYLIEKDINEGKARIAEPTEFKMKPVTFEITNQETSEVTLYEFEEEKTITVETLEQLDPETGKLTRTAYIIDNEEDMIRLSYSEGKIGATVIMSEEGELTYKYYLQGYETDRLVDLLYILHNESGEVLTTEMDNQVVRKLGFEQQLNNRENLLPMFIVFTGSLMGFFIVMAYIFLDKGEGVIKAFAVTPSAVWKYLISKMGVIMTTTIISSLVITIPVMGARINYLLFLVFLIVTTFASSSLGLLVASFFDDMVKAFGIMYGLIIALMIPAFSFYIPSFDPMWMRILPTYPMLQGYKEILLKNGDTGYVLIYSLVFLVSGLVLFALANIKFKKTLTL
ncbi:MAG: ABC transporter permease [Clostridiales bacterium]|nr:ABC transporter permease [Clostridiales bacterium]